MGDRCGSFPFRYISEDYGLPYGTVLRYADALDNGRGIPPADLKIVWGVLRDAWRVASLECHLMQALGWNDWPPESIR